jgi:hypothetical protein
VIICFAGTRDDESYLSIRGNGKTCSMTGYAYLDYLEGRHIWSNYKTTFSEEIIGFQTMIDKIGLTPHPDYILCITEMQELLNSIGSTTEQVRFIDKFATQLRKLDVDVYYDTQRFNNIHKRLRIHTDVILIPEKHHFDNKQCNFDRCKKPHKIYVYSEKPYFKRARKCFDATIVGKLYDSAEFMIDELRIPTKKELREIEELKKTVSSSL